MVLPNLSFTDFYPLLPALILTVGAILLLISEVFLTSPHRGYQALLALAFSAAAGCVALAMASEPARAVFNGMGILDPFSSLMSAVICLGLFLAVLISVGFLHARHAERGEYYALMLFAAAGMSLLSLSGELVTLFVSLEVLSVSTYALTAYLRRGLRTSEAGFKYFILGAFSTAVLLYGAALLYGATGTTHLARMTQALPAALQSQPALVYLGGTLVIVGLSFKVAAVPFHMWTPDVYEGAPTPVTAFMSAGVKTAAFAALVRLCIALSSGLDAVPGKREVLVLLFSTLALLTMVGGNLLALPQRNVKRMLAYSSIAHAGYVLVGVAALCAGSTTAVGSGFHLFTSTPLGTLSATSAQASAFKGIIFYLLAYTVTTVGAFGTLSALERREDEDRGTAWDLERFSGLAQRKPGWAVAMAAFMLSLGGIPPTVGFIGKLYIFRSAIDTGLLGLSIAAMLTSAAGVYYYLRVVVYMFMRPVPEGTPLPERRWATEFALIACTVAVIGLGILPNAVTGWFGHAGLLLGGR